MTTSEHWQASLWGASTSSPEDSPASLSLMPGSDAARTMTAGSGRKWLGLLANAGPAGCLVRTLLDSSTWASTSAWLTWKLSATKRGRLLFRLVPSAPRTEEIASGLWPTPTINGNNNRQGASPKSGDGLATAGRRSLLPSPSATDHKGISGPNQRRGQLLNRLLYPTPRAEGHDAVRHRGKPDSLHSYVKLFPTPHANCHTGAGSQGRDGGLKIQTAVQLLPTPTTQDAHNNGAPSQAARNSPPLNAVAGGALNPQWVEWLMGYPVGWTDLEA